MTIDQLKKGDVLLQKSFDKKDPVVVAQRRFTASHGTKWTSHALIVCDDKHLQVPIHQPKVIFFFNLL